MSDSPRPKILIVDDEPQIRRLLRVALDRAGYEVLEAATAREALSRLAVEKPDLVLLDLGLPDRDGLELLPLILARSEAKVLVVSAREATEEKVAALDLGADDFVTKPFDTDELLARVRVALRQRATAPMAAEVRELGDVSIDSAARVVRRGGQEVHLTPKEWDLLSELARHPGRVITHAQLLRTVWGPAHEQDVEYLRVTVRSLRGKLEADPAAPRLIINEPGVGYRIIVSRTDTNGRRL
jgi:two-component system, OmpR family, KDP operon response regulator KdpE